MKKQNKRLERFRKYGYGKIKNQFRNIVKIIIEKFKVKSVKLYSKKYLLLLFFSPYNEKNIRSYIYTYIQTYLFIVAIRLISKLNISLLFYFLFLFKI